MSCIYLVLMEVSCIYLVLIEVSELYLRRVLALLYHVHVADVSQVYDPYVVCVWLATS